MHDSRPGRRILERARAAQVGQHGRSDRARRMAHGAVAAILGLPQRDHLGGGGAWRRVERQFGKGRLGRQGRLPPELEDEQARHVAHRCLALDQVAVDRQRIGPAPARQHRDILLAIDRVGDRRRDHAGLGGKAPQLLAGARIIGVELASRGALEHEAAAGRQQAAVPGAGVLDRPAGLLRHRIPRHQHPAQASGHLLAEAAIGGQVARAEVEADIEAAIAIGLPVRLGGIHHPRLEGRDIDQLFLRAEGHRVPIVPAERTGGDQRGLAGLVDAGFRVLDRAACRGVDAGRPVDRDIGLGGDELPRLAVNHVEEAVLGCLHQHLSHPAADFHVGEHDVLGGGEVPRLPGRRLVVPDIFPGARPNRDDAGEVEVVPLPRPVLAGRAVGAVPGAAIADPDIEQVEIGIIGHRIPHRAPAADRVAFAQHVHVPGLGCLLEIGGRVGALLAFGDGVELPQLLAVIRVIGRDKAAHAEFGPAIADDHLAIDHARRTSDGVALGLVDRDRLPGDLAGVAVERDQAAIQRAEEQLVAIGGKTAVDDVAAGLDRGLAGNLGVILPQLRARGRVEGLHLAPRGGEVEPAVDDEGRRFLPACGVHVRRPGQAELADIVAVDRVERRIALLGIGAPVTDPVGAVRVGADQHRGGDALAALAAPENLAAIGQRPGRQQQRRTRGPTPQSHRSHTPRLSFAPCCRAAGGLSIAGL